MVSILSQALEEGIIDSIETPASMFFPFKKDNDKTDALTLKHMGQMNSGLNHYDYFKILKTAKLYYAFNSDDFLRTHLRVSRQPGGKFKYKSMDTQVLGNCMETMFDEEDLFNRFKEMYWDVIGPEHKGYFSVDKEGEGNLKYYGGLNITARDLAKIGKIYLNEGYFGEHQVISNDWMEIINDITNHHGKWDYCMGWYYDEKEEGRDIMYGAGFNGQYLILNKDTNVTIVRLGEKKGKHEWFHILSNLSTLF